MAISHGDILQFTEFQRQANQPLLNIYFYEVINPEGEIADVDLCEFFGSVMFVNLRDTFVSNQLSYERVELRNLTNQLDFALFDFNVTGESVGDVFPPYVTVTIKLNRSTLITRNGYKRYAGIPEGAGSNGTLSAGAISNWTTVAEKLAEPLEYTDMGNTVTLNPVIVGTNAETGEKDLSKINPIASASVNQRFGTQNTRKIKQFS